ncbi:hypothetical protein D3C83_292810 [compost metagenome]
MLHDAPLGRYGTLSRRDGHLQHKRDALYAGIVAGLLPERVREWRDLEEQVAML